MKFDLFGAFKRGAESAGVYRDPENPGGMQNIAYAADGNAPVSAQDAMGISTVFACVRLIAQTVAWLPLHLYKRENRSKEDAREHPLYDCLRNAANERMTAYQMREMMMVNVLLYGRAYAEIVRKGGVVTELWPIPTPFVQENTRANGSKEYTVSMDGKAVMIPERQMFVLSGIGYSGSRQYKPLEVARRALNIAMSAEQYGLDFFSQGIVPAAVIEYPEKISEKKLNELRQNFVTTYGPGSQGRRRMRLMFLEAGHKYSKIPISPGEAQFIETRQSQVLEICRFFNVPPFFVMSLDRATYSNNEQQDMMLLQHSMLPWLTNWEQNISLQLMTPAERAIYYPEFLVDALLKADAKTRAEVLHIMRQDGVINVDEWRAKENMNPIPDGQGEVYLAPLNLAPVSVVNDAGYLQQKTAPKVSADDTRSYAIEERANNGEAMERHRLTRRYASVLTGRMAGVFALEAGTVREAYDTVFVQRGQAEFREWLQDYYFNVLPPQLRTTMGGTFRVFADAIYRAAAKEIGLEDRPEDYDTWLRSYIDGYVDRHCAYSRNQIEALLDVDDPDAVLARLDEWEADDHRADKDGRWEAVRLAGAVAMWAFKKGGARKKVSRKTTPEKCRICDGLNGQAVGIDDEFDIPYGESSLAPPYHQGCQCQISSY